MKPIIDPIPVELLELELTEDRFVRDTNYGENEIFMFSHKDAPNLMLEVGRLREIAFRNAGGGTGREKDIDKYDVADTTPYQQMIVWEPREKRILGGYRYIFCRDVPRDENGNILLATAHLMRLSAKFITEYLPYTIELGRSFVHPDYQSSTALRKSIYTLDNLWDGLAALVINNPEIRYLFGKITMYASYNRLARDLILYVFKKHLEDNEKLVYPFAPISYDTDEEVLKNIINGADYKEDCRILSRKVRELGESIPPLINSYMNLSPTMKTFGTAINDEFGDMEETGILLTIEDIYPGKTKRHYSTYRPK